MMEPSSEWTVGERGSKAPSSESGQAALEPAKLRRDSSLPPFARRATAVTESILTSYCCCMAGPSVGMHRRFIHRGYSCKKFGLERACVYVGVLVGVAGPFGILRVHDERDWAQRQPACHDFFAHRRSTDRGSVLATQLPLPLCASARVHRRAGVRQRPVGIGSCKRPGCCSRSRSHWRAMRSAAGAG